MLLNDKDDPRHLRSSKFSNEPWEKEFSNSLRKMQTTLEGGGGGGGGDLYNLLRVLTSSLILLFSSWYLINWNLVTSYWSSLFFHSSSMPHFLYSRKTNFLAFSKVLCILMPQYTCTYCLPTNCTGIHFTMAKQRALDENISLNCRELFQVNDYIIDFSSIPRHL